MTSQKRQKRASPYAQGQTNGNETVPTDDNEPVRQRHATIYDAVAGRVSLKFSKDDATSCSYKSASGRHHLGDPILTPEEVLFSRKHTPHRYAERDIYFANESLPHSGREVLPGSDMLKAVHRYTSHFYEALGQRQDEKVRGTFRHINNRSMDETALLAFGILLEEAARECLGKNGDLVFTEGVHGDEVKVPRKQREVTPQGPQESISSEGEPSFL